MSQILPVLPNQTSKMNLEHRCNYSQSFVKLYCQGCYKRTCIIANKEEIGAWDVNLKSVQVTPSVKGKWATVWVFEPALNVHSYSMANMVKELPVLKIMIIVSSHFLRMCGLYCQLMSPLWRFPGS